jgi:putative LysE/RhtB family amino acid efflux pump
VATADASYAAIAAFGLTALTGLLVGIDRPLGVVGGAILLVLAARSLRGAVGASIPAASIPAAATPAAAIPAAARPEDRRPRGLAAAFASMVGLTLTNPATILSFAALFASIGAGTGGPGGAVLVVLGVFTGSVAWWALLTGVVARLRTRLTPRVVRVLNVVAALAIGGFGIAAVALGIAG